MDIQNFLYSLGVSLVALTCLLGVLKLADQAIRYQDTVQQEGE